MYGSIYVLQYNPSIKNSQREINVECILREVHHFSHDYDSPFEETLETKSD